MTTLRARQISSMLPKPEIGIKSPDFGFGPAPFPTLLRPTQFRYAAVIKQKQVKGYTRPLSYFSDGQQLVSKFFEIIPKFEGLLSEADVINLTTTCAMGMRQRAHAQPDEGRAVGRTFAIQYRSELLAEVKDDWMKHVDALRKKGELNKLDLVLPTGTSLGWPFLFPDDANGVRTLVLAALVAAIDTSKKQGMSLRDVLSFLESKYGPRFIAPGWRYQHSAKVMPILYDRGLMYSTNVEFRTRLIAMVDKTSIVYNREVAKIAIKAALTMSQHNQDRVYIKNTFDQWRRVRGRKQIAVDVSGFDNAFGGSNLTTLLKVLSEITGRPEAYNDLVSEVTAPMLVPYGRDVYQTNTLLTPQLPSGASFTTAIGLLASDYIVRLLGYHMRLKRGDGPRDFRYLSWGDDIVIDVPGDVDVEAAFKSVGKELEIAFDFEPTLKYLGFDYGSGSVQTFGGYSVGRLLQKSVFPESVTMYPYSVIGYVARLSFVEKDPRRFHELYLTHLWDEKRLGRRFTFDQRHEALQTALKKAAAEPRENRDVLNFLLHGLNPIEGQDLLDSLDFNFQEWVGGTYIDFSDPERVIASLQSDLAKMAVPWLSAITKQGMGPFLSFVDQLSLSQKWRREGVLL